MSKLFAMVTTSIMSLLVFVIYAFFSAAAAMKPAAVNFPYELLPTENDYVSKPKSVVESESKNRFMDITIKGNFYNKRLTKHTIDSIDGEEKKTKMLHFAYTIWCEGKGEGSLGMAYVGSVIRNRLEYSGFSNNLMEVLHDPADFSCWGKDGKTQILTVNKEYVRFLQALELAIGLYEGYIVPITSASHYHTTSVSPSWADKITKLEKYKNHIFYIEESRR